LGIVFDLNLKEFLKCIWDRIDKGSWICPQLLGFVKIKDKSFDITAHKLLQKYEVKNLPDESASLDEISRYDSAKKNIELLKYALGKNSSLEDDKKQIFDKWLSEDNESGRCEDNESGRCINIL
jgi:hypothetical protein